MDRKKVNLLIYISNLVIPFVVFYVVGMGIVNKQNVYDDFVAGAKEGMKTVITVMPTLIGLMVGVGVLSSSGFLEFLISKTAGMTGKIGIPAVVMPTVIIRMFSSSAATGLVLDIFKQYGTDSYEGILSAIMMSSTETIFYTLSVYCMTAKVTKVRWTLAGALVSTFAGVAASVILAGMMV